MKISNPVYGTSLLLSYPTVAKGLDTSTLFHWISLTYLCATGYWIIETKFHYSMYVNFYSHEISN